MNHGSTESNIKLQNSKLSNELLSRKQIEVNAQNKFIHKYRKDTSKQYNKKVIEELIFNRKTHLVALFKEYMIADYIDDFLKREYRLKESKERIPKFSQYYQNYSIFFGMPTFSDFEANDIIKDYGERKAEVYYNKHYKMINDDEGMNCDSNSNSSSSNERNKMSRIMMDKTIFNSKIKDNIDNATMFTNKNTDSNMISATNTIQRIINSTNRSKVLNDSSLIMNQDEIIASTDNNNLVSSEASLISYIKLFSKHQISKAKQINRRIQVKKLCQYPPSTILTKRKNKNKDSEGGNGTNSETSNNVINNHSITKLKGMISASNLYCKTNKKQQLNKTPLNNIKSNISSNSNASNQNLNGNLSKKSLSVKKTKSRNVKQSEIGFKTDYNRGNTQQKIQLTKTQKIDNIVRKYSINFATKKLTASLKKKGSSSSQLKLQIKNQPLIVSQLSKKSLFKLNHNILKGKNVNTFNITNEKTSSKPKQNRNQSKQSADDLMKMALTLLIENKPTKSNLNANANSNPHVNININNQININTNYPLQDSINTKLAKNDSVTMNINNNLSNLLKGAKHSRNKSTNNGLVSSTDDDRTIASSGKGRIFGSYCLAEKKQRSMIKKNDTPNTFNRPTSIDLLLKQNQHHPQFQQHQITSYLCKDTITKQRPKITSSSTNRLFQTMNQPLIVNTYTKSIQSVKNKKPFN